MRVKGSQIDGGYSEMTGLKSWIGILVGIVILVADIAWLIVGSSYSYAPWLILGIVSFFGNVDLASR